jgi:hypothetical protein
MMTEIETVQGVAARVLGVPAPMWQTTVLSPGQVRVWVDVKPDAPEFMQTFAGKAWVFTKDASRLGWRYELVAGEGKTL